MALYDVVSCIYMYVSIGGQGAQSHPILRLRYAGHDVIVFIR